MGHPAAAVAWLVNTLAARGQHLRAGSIVLTGGLTYSKLVRDNLRRRVIRLAPVIVYAGSLEMAALAAGAIDMLSGRHSPTRYKASTTIDISRNIGGN
jgi:butyrate kinase